LTVLENLKYIAQIKGVSSKNMKEELDKAIDACCLRKEIDKLA